MRRDKRIAGMFDKDKVKVAVEQAIKEILEWEISPVYKGRWTCPDETSTYMLDLIASDWRGIYQPHHIIREFGIRLDPNWAYVWEELDEIFESVSDLLNKAIPLSHSEFGYLALGFGHAEASPDWGLQLVFELKR